MDRLNARNLVRLFCGVLLLCGWTWLTGCASLPGVTAARVSVKKHPPKIILQATQSGWGTATHPFMVAVSSNRFALTYWVAGDGAIQGVAPVPWPLYTDDGGASWQPGNPYEWNAEHEPVMTYAIDEGRRFERFNMGIFFSSATLPNGDRVIFSRNALSKNSAFLRIVSTDGGQTWDPPEPVRVEYPEGMMDHHRLFHVEGPGAVMPDGRLLITGYGGTTHGVWSTYLFESTDGGQSFSYVSTVASPFDAPWAKGGPSEPALLALPSGELLMMMRTNTGGSMSGFDTAAHLLQARSQDGGQTWSLKRTHIPGVMPKLRLLENGVIVLAYGRPGNNLLFSLDGGRSWGGETSITAPDRATTGYIDVVEVAPNRLLAVYDLKNEPLERFWLWEPKRVSGLVAQYIDVGQRF